jgi:hypothetical protein
MKYTLKGLLFEAYRRNDMTESVRPNGLEMQKPLSERWLGLGTEAAYRPALAAGLMRFHDGQTPPPRCMGWLCLTDAGIKEIQKHEEEFKRVLGLLKADTTTGGYACSYAANYMLAGGITAS